jgi:uncharacterized delta-60 repeat protein
MSRRYKGGVISATAPTTSTSSAAGFWTLNQQMVAIAAGQWPLQPSYWIGLLGGSVSDIGNSVAVDNSGNIYICGQSNNSGSFDIQMAKYNSFGVIQWQRRLGSGNTEIGSSVAVSTLGNVYFLGSLAESGSNYFSLSKYNDSGTIQWQRSLGLGATQNSGFSVAVDTSENIYVCGTSTASGGITKGQIAKYNSSGTIQWQRRLDGVVELGELASVVTGYSGNVYTCGVSDASLPRAVQIVKYDSLGTIQWQRSLRDTVNNSVGKSVTVDSSENVYVCGNSGNNFQIVKYNSSGTIQWQRTLGSSGQGQSIAADGSGNIYVCGSSSASGTNNFQIAKYNTSGTIQWQRSLGGNAADLGRSVAVDAFGNVYVCGQANASGTDDFMFAKLPADGSRTGTYVVGSYSITYAASSLTDAVSTSVSATSSLANSTSSLTSATSTLTDAASTLTSSVTQI